MNGRHRELHTSQRESWTLWEIDGRPVLDVLCGGIAMYSRMLPLDAEELGRWRDEGEAFLDELATRVRRRERDYADRYLA